jgi:hypothetical protein
VKSSRAKLLGSASGSRADAEPGVRAGSTDVQ